MQADVQIMLFPTTLDFENDEIPDTFAPQVSAVQQPCSGRTLQQQVARS